MATHSSTLAWKIPWTEEPCRLTVHGVTKSQTRLSDITSLLHFTPAAAYRPKPGCMKSPDWRRGRSFLILCRSCKVALERTGADWEGRGFLQSISWYNSHLKTLKIKGGAFRNSLETADGNQGCAWCQAARGLTLPVTPTPGRVLSSHTRLRLRCCFADRVGEGYSAEVRPGI